MTKETDAERIKRREKEDHELSARLHSIDCYSITAAERDEQRDFDQEMSSTIFMKSPEYYPDTYKEEYPPNLDNIEDYYWDAAGLNIVEFGDRRISSTYLPMGIKNFDSWYGKEIRKENSRYTKEELEDMIRRNPHLHNVIKTNLLSNLNYE